MRKYLANSTNKYIRVLTWILTILLIVLVFINALNVHSNESIFLLFCIGSSLVITVAFLFSGNLNLHNPLVYILLTVFIGVTVRGYYIIYFADRPEVQRLFLVNNDILYFISPAILIFFSLVLFVLGYKFTQKPFEFKYTELFNKYQIWKKNRLYTLVIIFTLVSIVGIYLFVSSLGIFSIFSNISSKRFLDVSGSEYQASLGYYRLMANFMTPAFFITFVHYLINKKSLFSIDGFFLLFLGFLNLLYSFFVSSRGGVVFFILNILVILSIYNRITLRAVILGPIFAGLIFSVMTTLRPSKTTDIRTFNLDLFDPIILNRNLLDVSVTSKIFNEVPDKLEFQYGATFLSLFVAPVPRIYWPSKPAINPGKTVSRKLYDFDKNNQAGVPPGIIGELYINFGIIGVLLGLLLTGIFIKKIYLYFNFKREIRKNKVILYIAVIMNTTVILFGGSITQAFLNFLQEFVILYLGLSFISQKNSNSISSAHPNSLK